MSIAPKDISWVLPGTQYTAADLDRFLQTAASDGGDLSLLEIAWAVAVDEGAGKSYSLAEMSELLFDSSTPLSQYTTYHMLLKDAVYFKQAKGPLLYEPRTADAVAAAQAVAAAAAAKLAAQAAWVAAAQAAQAAGRGSKPSQQQWAAGEHADRIAALKTASLKVVYPKVTEELARESLSLLGMKPHGPDPQHLAAVAWQLLLDLGAEQLHAPLPLLRTGLSMGAFPAAVEKEAEAVMAVAPRDPDAHLRRDLSHLVTFTVDDASTTEVDDAISIEQLPAGQGQKLWIHVADPTRWVAPGSGLDGEARSRTRTLYFPWGAVPMFPATLAEELFSLTNKADQQHGAATSSSSGSCCAISVGVQLDEEGGLASWEVSPSVISIDGRLTYDDADEDLALGPDSCKHPELQLLYQAARARKAWRVSHGCIDIDLPEAKLAVPLGDLDSTDPCIKIEKISQWESAARMMVAEMMILAGEAVGALGVAEGLPLPYRGQGAPQLPNPEVLEALPEGPCKGYALRRCMTRSSIEPMPQRHASLALDAYVQFTSPIRRYADMMAHWNVKAWLRGQPPPFSAADISRVAAAIAEVGRDLGRAEGEVGKYWTAEYLRQHRKEEWAATVLGTFRSELSLVAVSLETLGVETIVKVDLPVFPGERLSVKLVDVHVPTGYWRMAVQGMLDSPVTAARAAAALADVAASGDEAGNMEELATGGEEGGEVGFEGVVVEVDELVSGDVGGVAAAVSATAAAAMAAGLVFGLDVTAAVVAPPVAAAAGL